MKIPESWLEKLLAAVTIGGFIMVALWAWSGIRDLF